MFKSFFLGVIVVSSIVTKSPVMAEMKPSMVVNENPPAETFQPGFWQPIARVDMAKPITLKIINDSGVLLDYAFTDDNVEPLKLEQDATRSIEKIQAPVYVVIYPDIKNPNASRINLKYFVEVTADNVVELRVKQTESISQGNRTFNLQSTGAIYLY